MYEWYTVRRTTYTAIHFLFIYTHPVCQIITHKNITHMLCTKIVYIFTRCVDSVGVI